MRFDKTAPADRLKPYVKYLAISESEEERSYKVFPSTGLVMGFQYRGMLSDVVNGNETKLSGEGITGIQHAFKIFKNSPKIGTILVCFTETGASHFFKNPLNELFSLSLSLDHFFADSEIASVQEQLTEAVSDARRIAIVENFLISKLIEKADDILILQAIRHIHQSNGTIRIHELNKILNVSQSPLEKRFRAVVGTSPKKFSSIVRFNSVLKNLGQNNSLAQLGYDNDYFDQAHFIKDFKAFTGESPEKFLKAKSE
jgi:AraC-like DNA-binding protein